MRNSFCFVALVTSILCQAKPGHRRINPRPEGLAAILAAKKAAETIKTQEIALKSMRFLFDEQPKPTVETTKTQEIALRSMRFLFDEQPKPKVKIKRQRGLGKPSATAKAFNAAALASRADTTDLDKNIEYASRSFRNLTEESSESTNGSSGPETQKNYCCVQ